MNILNDYRVNRALAVAWIALIFFLSSKSDIDMPDMFSMQDKLVHGIVFAILGIFFARSFKTYPAEQAALIKRILLVTLMVTLYGGLDETHQFFVNGRDASFADLFADAIGGLIGASVIYGIKLKP
jgi:VanZ family protein